MEQCIENAGEILTLQVIFSCLKERLASKNLPSPQITAYGLPNELGICKNPVCQNISSTPDIRGISKPTSLPPNDEDTSFVVSGKIKIELCRRLGADWQDLADYLEIPAYRRNQFQQGRECQAIWEWLAERKKLPLLKEALKVLDRQDLIKLLNTDK